MASDGENGRTRVGTRAQIWLYPVLLLGAATTLVFVGVYLVDWVVWSPTAEELQQARLAARPGPLGAFLSFDAPSAQNALTTLAQVTAAILGIVITVVSIVVQLASTRYTPRVAEMFFRDRTNLLILGFFVIVGIDSIWVGFAVTSHFVPRASIGVSLILVTTAVLLMVPYFAYVFDFLDPEKVVSRIQQQALASALGTGDVHGTVPQRQSRVLTSIEQLGDVSINAVAQKDKLIAQGAADALKRLVVSYLPYKTRSQPAWFDVSARLRQNPDFVSMSPESVDDIATHRVWLEWKVLRQYQTAFNDSLGHMPEMSLLVAINTRYIGESAIAAADRHVVGLAIKFFNTYLRAALNADQVRTAYNTLNQYRQLTERALAVGQEALVVEVAGYLRYYSQIAHGKRLSFITETVAYDLATLCEVAHAKKADCHDALLRVLLDIDRAAETVEQETMLRGVRKAQAKLASYYLAAGDEAAARLIYEDMKNEPPARLASICGELLAITSKDYWEVIDRGSNFDYMDEPRKAELRRFFSWFPSMSQPPAVAARS